MMSTPYPEPNNTAWYETLRNYIDSKVDEAVEAAMAQVQMPGVELASPAIVSDSTSRFDVDLSVIIPVPGYGNDAVADAGVWTGEYRWAPGEFEWEGYGLPIALPVSLDPEGTYTIVIDMEFTHFVTTAYNAATYVTSATEDFEFSEWSTYYDADVAGDGSRRKHWVTVGAGRREWDYRWANQPEIPEPRMVVIVPETARVYSITVLEGSPPVAFLNGMSIRTDNERLLLPDLAFEGMTRNPLFIEQGPATRSDYVFFERPGSEFPVGYSLDPSQGIDWFADAALLRGLEQSRSWLRLGDVGGVQVIQPGLYELSLEVLLPEEIDGFLVSQFDFGSSYTPVYIDHLWPMANNGSTRYRLDRQLWLPPVNSMVYDPLFVNSVRWQASVAGTTLPPTFMGLLLYRILGLTGGKAD